MRPPIPAFHSATTIGSAKMMLAPKLFGSPSVVIDADHAGDAHAVRVPAADVFAERVQQVQPHHREKADGHVA